MPTMPTSATGRNHLTLVHSAARQTAPSAPAPNAGATERIYDIIDMLRSASPGLVDSVYQLLLTHPSAPVRATLELA